MVLNLVPLIEHIIPRM